MAPVTSLNRRDIIINQESYDLCVILPLSLNSFHKEKYRSKNKLNCLLGKPGEKKNVLVLKKKNQMNLSNRFFVRIYFSNSMKEDDGTN